MRNYTTSINYMINAKRIEQVNALSTEYINLLALLYGGDIRTGFKQVKDFHHMTMSQLEVELKLRTLLMHGEVTRLRNDLKEEHAQNEQALLDQLKKSTA